MNDNKKADACMLCPQYHDCPFTQFSIFFRAAACYECLDFLIQFNAREEKLENISPLPYPICNN